jgi:tetratricopeptide (TPR) repeat protein
VRSGRKQTIAVLALLVILWLGQATAGAVAEIEPLLAAGRVDEAIGDAQEVLRREPENAQAHILLARAYYALEDWDRAVAEAERATKLEPKNSQYFLWLGRAYGERASNANFLSAMGLAKKAGQAFERAVELDPSSTAARSDLTEFYLGAPGFLGGGSDKAGEQIAALSKLDAAAAHLMKARVAEKKDNQKLAVEEFEAAIRTSGNQASYWLNRASYYRRKGRPAEMEQTIGRALDAPRRDSSVLFDAAEMLERSGRNFTLATELLRRYLASETVEEAPAFRAHVLLGSILEKQNKKAEAAEEYRKALAMAKDFRAAREALRKIERR